MVDLLLECVGEVFDDRVREKSFTHLSQLLFDLLPGLLTVRKHDPKQLARSHIFHTAEPERAQRVLDGLPLRIENGGLALAGVSRDVVWAGRGTPRSRRRWAVAVPTAFPPLGARGVALYPKYVKPARRIGDESNFFRAALWQSKDDATAVATKLLDD